MQGGNYERRGKRKYESLQKGKEKTTKKIKKQEKLKNPEK